MAYDIYVATFLILLAVGARSLYYIIVHPRTHRFVASHAVPSLIGIVEIIELMTVAIEDPALEFRQRAICHFPLVVDAVAIRRKRIRTK